MPPTATDGPTDDPERAGGGDHHAGADQEGAPGVVTRLRRVSVLCGLRGLRGLRGLGRLSRERDLVAVQRLGQQRQADQPGREADGDRQDVEGGRAALDQTATPPITASTAKTIVGAHQVLRASRPAQAKSTALITKMPSSSSGLSL